MSAQVLRKKIEDLILEVFSQRQLLPIENRPISQETLVSVIVSKFGDGDISTTISEVIEYMEHGKFILTRTLQGELELVIRKKSR